MAIFLKLRLRVLFVLIFVAFLFTFLFRLMLRDVFLFFNPPIALPSGPCDCSQCIMDPDDAWFSEKFNMSVQPLLSRVSSELSNDTYWWWQQLQSETNPANLSMVMELLFQEIPGEERYMDAGPHRCRRCSVVGNSGNLYQSYYGPLIDSSDFVIRINQARTQGFEQDVGFKTTHHVMYPESAIPLDSTTTNLLLVPFKTLDLEWLISALTTGKITYTYMPVMSLINVNKQKVMVYSPTFMKYVHETWLERHGTYPSTGFLSLIFALHICDQVNVFGFGADHLGSWHHYWEDNGLGDAFRYTGVHNADFEYKIIRKLAEKRKITLFKGVNELQFQWSL